MIEEVKEIKEDYHRDPVFYDDLLLGYWHSRSVDKISATRALHHLRVNLILKRIKRKSNGQLP